MPLHLCGAGVRHGTGEDGEDGGLSVEDGVVEDCLVLGDSDGEGDVVVFGPTAQWVQEEDGALVATGLELLLGVGHEEGVSVVDWVAKLEDGKFSK